MRRLRDRDRIITDPRSIHYRPHCRTATVKALSRRKLCDGSFTVSVTGMRLDASSASSRAPPEKPLRLHRHRDGMFIGTAESHLQVAAAVLTWKRRAVETVSEKRTAR